MEEINLKHRERKYFVLCNLIQTDFAFVNQITVYKCSNSDFDEILTYMKLSKNCG
jgi:hypothetical protein